MMTFDLMSTVFAYLRAGGAAFRLTNYPVPEAQPAIAHPLRPGGHNVSTRVVLVDGRAALACVPEGMAVNAAGLAAALGASVLQGTTEDLPGEFRGAPEPIPPLGRLIGIPLFVDERLAASTVLAFSAFSRGVCVEIAYGDFARIEQPKMVSLAIGGSLTEHARA